MADHQLTFCYSDTDVLIEVGDRIVLDGHRGTVEEVCLPGTDLARTYSCEDTGGLLILFEGGILVLEPIGVFAFVEQQIGDVS
jgi:hypothetical protein